MKLKRKLVDIFLIAITVLSITGAITAVNLQSSFITVVSASMEPTISPGDTLLIRYVNRYEIEKNDIVVLPVPTNKSLRYSHRVLEVARELNSVVLQTKGDANPNPDKWLIRVNSEKTPRVVAIIPTSFIFGGAIERKWMIYALFGLAALLSLIAASRLLRGRKT
jgi:signal peptidase I